MLEQHRLLLSACLGILIFILLRIRKRFLNKRRNVIIVSTDSFNEATNETHLNPLTLSLISRFLQAGDCVVVSVSHPKLQTAIASALKVRFFASLKCVVCDVTSGSGLQELYSRALDFFGGHRINLWINNTAG